jgi:hypothetical protein
VTAPVREWSVPPFIATGILHEIGQVKKKPIPKIIDNKKIFTSKKRFCE